MQWGDWWDYSLKNSKIFTQNLIYFDILKIDSAVYETNIINKLSF